MKNILGKVVAEHTRLKNSGKEPDSLFLNKESLDQLAKQAEVAYDVQAASVRKEFLGMQVFTSAQYRDGAFRIYCKPVFTGELNGL